MSETTQTAWPEGVIARYLTVAGVALTDPTICTEVIANEGDYDSAHCVPCGSIAKYDMEIARRIAARRGSDPDFLLPSHLAWQWAQEHAEKCRAMPRPTN